MWRPGAVWTVPVRTQAADQPEKEAAIKINGRKGVRSKGSSQSQCAAGKTSILYLSNEGVEETPVTFAIGGHQNFSTLGVG